MWFGLCMCVSQDNTICLPKLWKEESEKKDEENRAEERENLWTKTNINAMFFILCWLGIHDYFSWFETGFYHNSASGWKGIFGLIQTTYLFLQPDPESITHMHCARKQTVCTWDELIHAFWHLPA